MYLPQRRASLFPYTTLFRSLKAARPYIAGAKVEVTGGFERPPLERTAAVVRLFEMARSVAAEIGVTLEEGSAGDRKSTRLNSSHLVISYAVFCLKKKMKHLR